MDTFTFNVKDKSVMEFFKQNIVGLNLREMDQSPYYFFKDEIIIKKGDYPGTITFKLADMGRADKSLINTYVYKVEPYDDISFKLTLQTFSVEAGIIN